MANRWYGLGLNLFLTGGVDAATATLKCTLVTSSYTPNFSTDQYLNVISSGYIVTTGGVALTSVTCSLGTLSAGSLTWASVSGSQAAYVILYQDTGLSSSSPLLGYIDTATGLPVTPNGGNITINWASGQVATLRQDLDFANETAAQRLRRWLKDSRRKHGSLWVPEPQIVLG